MILKKTAATALFIAAAVSLLPQAGVSAADMAARFHGRLFHNTNNVTLPYRLLMPKDYRPARKYPIVLFLHGVGERGSDNLRQLYAGLDIFAAEKTMELYPCFIVAPQCPVDMKWADVDWKANRHTMQKAPTAALSSSIDLVRELSKEYSIDTSRIYVAGYSMGGFGAWEAIQRWPDLFAAAVPVCGGGDETQAHRIAGIAVWAFHGALDPLVKVSRSRDMVNAVKRAGGAPRYTEYPTINHFSWGIAFSDQSLFEWLFKQKK